MSASGWEWAAIVEFIVIVAGAILAYLKRGKSSPPPQSPPKS